MSAEWVTATAAVGVLLIQLGMGFLLWKIRGEIHTALEEFRAWVEKTFETKELANKREQMLSQRITDING